MRLQRQVALITGGGGAIGGAQARLFAREGAAVVVADLRSEKAARVATEIERDGGSASAVACLFAVSCMRTISLSGLSPRAMTFAANTRGSRLLGDGSVSPVETSQSKSR